MSSSSPLSVPSAYSGRVRQENENTRQPRFTTQGYLSAHVSRAGFVSPRARPVEATGTGRRDVRGIRRGFSFAELLIVILISGILLTIATPRMTASLQLFRVTNAAKRIALDLNRAQLAAYNSSLTRTVNFDVVQNQYAIPEFAPLSGGAGAYVVKLSANPFHVTLVTIWGQTNNQTLTYNGYGIPSQGGNIVIACGSVQKTIQVNSATGLAVIL